MCVSMLYATLAGASAGTDFTAPATIATRGSGAPATFRPSSAANTRRTPTATLARSPPRRRTPTITLRRRSRCFARLEIHAIASTVATAQPATTIEE